MTEDKQAESNWLLYIVENALGHWYTGITNDLERRLASHRSGKGAKSLRGKGPLTLIIAVAGLSKRDAARLEWQVKQLNKRQKVQLVSDALTLASDKTTPVIDFDTCANFSKLILSKESSVE
ncbi:GIY-YIG nuclease family protein [Pseudoalteromonas luteoviolacea]|uniref:GIY-YIG nuclease family protein n=1 Tax=Pseudoalteromonas luteoviolacea TaxID=43657 RepID=UPI001B37C557|nr:GIY-YIG nuclease family protein [Pseudoalteromonas luteoviolacea]